MPIITDLQVSHIFPWPTLALLRPSFGHFMASCLWCRSVECGHFVLYLLFISFPHTKGQDAGTYLGDMSTLQTQNRLLSDTRERRILTTLYPCDMSREVQRVELCALVAGTKLPKTFVTDYWRIMTEY